MKAQELGQETEGSSVTAQKRSCNSATCITHWLGGLLSRTGTTSSFTERWASGQGGWKIGGKGRMLAWGEVPVPASHVQVGLRGRLAVGAGLAQHDARAEGSPQRPVADHMPVRRGLAVEVVNVELPGDVTAQVYQHQRLQFVARQNQLEEAPSRRVGAERQAHVDQVHGALTHGAALDGEVVQAARVVQHQAAPRQRRDHEPQAHAHAVRRESPDLLLLHLAHEADGDVQPALCSFRVRCVPAALPAGLAPRLRSPDAQRPGPAQAASPSGLLRVRLARLLGPPRLLHLDVGLRQRPGLSEQPPSLSSHQSYTLYNTRNHMGKISLPNAPDKKKLKIGFFM
ncbi:hypothetical protein MC885_001536, partial [Smutsia gigantea]